MDLGPGVFGLLSLPSAADACGTTVVLFNSGIMHRAGPFRVTVRLARALAALGYATVRFDFPGVGDSLQHADRPILEITRDILDRVQAQTHCDRFVVGGICSAADLGWQLALDDSRVIGVIMLDGLARKGWWFNIGRLTRALRTPPSTWPAMLRRRLAWRRHLSVKTAETLRDWPQPGAERAQLRQLLARGVRLLMVFTGGTSYFLNPRQFRETYGATVNTSAIDFHYWPHCDHMFYAASGREQLITETCKWMSRSFP